MANGISQAAPRHTMKWDSLGGEVVAALPEEQPAAEARDQVRTTAQLTSFSVLRCSNRGARVGVN